MKLSRIISLSFCAVVTALSAAPVMAAPPEIVRSSAAGTYLLNGQATRLVFPDRETVATWGDPSAQDVELPALSRWFLSGVLPIREGSRLVKFGTDPMVYAVSPRGTLQWIKNEEIAAALYGAAWNSRVISLPPSFYVNYKYGAPIVEPRHPDGTLLKADGAPTVYYLAGGVARPFATERAFRENRFSFSGVVSVPAIAYVKGNPINAWEPDLNLLP